MIVRVLILMIIPILLVIPIWAENWPQWRGPNLNGTSRETGLPTHWNTTENISWKLKMPDRSGATPIIWGEYIFLNVANGEELYLWAVDRRDGTVRWTKLIGGGNRMYRKQNMSSPSPVTDGQSVWVLTGTGILKRFDFDGTELWARDIQQDYGAFGLNWGFASSPLLHDDGLYIPVLHGMKTTDPSYVLKIDKVTGRTIWRVERPTAAHRESPDAYTTPALLQYDGKEEIVVSGGDVVTGYDPKSGKELWRSGGLNPEKRGNHRIVASPLVVDGLIYVPSRVRPLLVLKSGGRGDVTDTHLAWSFDDGPDVPTPVSDGQYFYIVNDKGIVYCLDAKTGSTIWGPERVAPGIYSASPILADGKLYLTSEDGITTVIKAGAQFEVLAQNDLEDYCLSTPAVSEGQIFIRTTKHLHCIGSRK